MTHPRSAGTSLALAVFLVAGCSSPTPRAPAAPDTSTPAAPAVTGLLPDPDGVQPTPSTAADPAAVATATKFAARWARPHVPAARWRAEVRPYAVPAYADLLDTVDPANVPATRTTAPGRVVTATPDRTEVDIGTDAGVLRVVCVRNGTRWLVATLSMPRDTRR